MKATKPIYYPDPVIFDKARTIYTRFDNVFNTVGLNQPIYFTNDDVLHNKIITGIEIKTTKKLTQPESVIQTDLGFIGEQIGNGVLKYFTITLVGKNGEVILNECPMTIFNLLTTEGKIRRTSMMIDLSKSFIRNFGVTITAINTIPITFYYRDLK